jgi:hypothetical protein
MQPGGLGDSGVGIITAQRVRLMHAAIRCFLKQKNFDTEKFGVPINQQDKAGTLLAFSALTIQGLIQLGIELTPEQRNAYQHCWNVIGYISGVDERLIKHGYADALALGNDILRDQQGSSEAGQALTKSCIRYLQHLLPGNLLDDLPAIAMRYFTGDEMADMLAIPAHASAVERLAWHLLQHELRAGALAEQRHRIVRKLFAQMQMHFMNALLNSYNPDKGRMFEIPPSLRRNWKLNHRWANQRVLLQTNNHRLVWQKKQTG